KKGRVSRLTAFEGLLRQEVAEATAGEIVAIAGFADVEIGETFADAIEPERLEPIAIDEPTVSMYWLVNDSPFAGTEGKFVTSRNLRERLERETRKDVALRVRETEQADRFEVSGRGELHLSILAENMRREDYEFALSRPQVILKEAGGRTLEPYEALVVDIDEAHVGTVMEKLQARRAEMTDMVNPGSGRVRIEFKIPTRGLFGIRTEFLSETRGTGLLYHTFLQYGPYRGEIASRNRGALVAKEAGDAAADHDARAMPGMDRRRRAGRSHPRLHPHPQEDPRSLPARGGAEKGGGAGLGEDLTGRDADARQCSGAFKAACVLVTGRTGCG